MTGAESPAAPIVPNALHFLPLGGAGEIGMNLNLYACHGKWLMVDLGITFAGDSLPGVDIIMPDPAFIEARRDNLLAIVVTHAHEDHLGAIAYLWPRLRCPVYATPFAAAILRDKLREVDLLEKVELHEVPLAGRISLAPFEIEFVSLTHSIPEPNALILRTPYGTVMHTGDWKIDPDPLIGDNIDEAALRRIGDEGILAMVCDSTNALVEGESGSEGQVRKSLIGLIGECTQGVAVSLFASNVARLESAAVAALENGREPVLVGRSLWRYATAARQTGYLNGDIRLVSEEEGASLHPDQAVYLCTGCQGEPRAAMARIASDTHPRIGLSSGDTVIFSSKVIPGNERTIGTMHNRLASRGIAVIMEKDHAVHVSGHPCRDELARMYQWIRPEIAVPVHGETRHLIEHAALAKALQVPHGIVIENGDLIRLQPGGAIPVDQVFSGRLVLDGGCLVAPDHSSIRVRRRLMNDGAIFLAIVVDDEGRLLAEPRLSAKGVLDGDDDEDERMEVIAAAQAALAELPRAKARDEEYQRETARVAVRRAVVAKRGKRPLIDVQIMRLGG